MKRNFRVDTKGVGKKSSALTYVTEGFDAILININYHASDRPRGAN